MQRPQRRHVEHRVQIDTPAETAYSLVADVENWPWVFHTAVHVERLEGSETADRIAVWSATGDRTNYWTAHRNLDPGQLRISYRQEEAQAPVADMGGVWEFDPLDERSCLVRLRHDYLAVREEPRIDEWIGRVLDQNSEAELGALKAAAELSVHDVQCLMRFSDSAFSTAPADQLFGFLHSADSWSHTLPHIVSSDLQDASTGIHTPALQRLRLESRTPEGRQHRSEQIRVSFPESHVHFKYLSIPPLASLHIGHWSVRCSEIGSTVTAHHMVAIDRQGVQRVLGESATIGQALDYVRQTLGAGNEAVFKAMNQAVGANA